MLNMATNGELQKELEPIVGEFRRLVKVYEEAKVFPAHKLALREAIEKHLKTHGANKCLRILKHASPDHFNRHLEPLLMATGKVVFEELAAEHIPENEKFW